MTNKEKFLKQNVGFHFTDLSVARQLELETIQKTMGLSMDWIYLALSKDKLENWEKWGFSLFKKDDFKRTIDESLKILDRWGEDELGKKLKEKEKPVIDLSNYNPKVITVSIKNPQRRPAGAANASPAHSISTPTGTIKSRGRIFDELDGK